MLSQVSIYLKHSDADAALTIDDLEKLMRAGGNRARSVMQRMHR